MTVSTQINAVRLFGTQLVERAQDRFGGSTVRSVLGLADQAVVSGSRFVATITIGRLCGAEELGFYGLGFTFVVLFACAQEALIALPYTAKLHDRKGREAEEYAGTVLLYSLLLGVLSAIVLAGWAWYQSTLAGWAAQASVFGVVAVFLPGVLLWEFGRRIGFAQQRVAAVFALDAVTAGCWLTTLAAFAWTGNLSPSFAFVAMGTSHATVTVLWFCLYGQRFRVSFSAALKDSLSHWRFGRWILGSETLFMARSNIVPWIIAALLGSSDTGLFIAYLTIVVLGNPILHGISNVLAPDLTLAYAEEGRAGIRRVVVKATSVLGIAMIGFSSLLAFIGEPLIARLYGPAFGGQQLCVAILAFGLLVESIGMPSYNGLWAMQRPNLCFVACLLGLVATVVLTLVCTSALGLVGAAIGYTAGKVVSSIVQGIAVCYALRRDRQEGTLT